MTAPRMTDARLGRIREMARVLDEMAAMAEEPSP